MLQNNSGSTATRQLNDSEDNGVAVNGADASAASADDTQSSMHHSVSEEGEDLKMKQFKKRQYVFLQFYCFIVLLCYCFITL